MEVARDLPRPARARGLSRRSLVLVAMALGLLAINLDFTVVNLGLAPMQRDLDTSLSDLQWVINAYTLALAGAVVIAGRLGDALGRKRVYLVGTLVFTAAAVAAALAPSVEVLAGTRAVQGLGAATVYTVSLAILSNTFPPEERGRALGIWTAVAALGLAAGPLVGGAVVESASWRWLFVLLVPFAAASFVIALACVRESRDETAPRTIDVAGAVTSALALVALVTLFIEARGWGLASVETAICAGIVVVAGAAFVFVERRAPVPLVELGLFRNRPFLGACVTSFALAFAAWAALFFLPLDFQHVRHHSALAAGLLLLPCTALWALTSLLTGRVVHRVGTRVPMAAGLLLTAAGLAALAIRDPTIGVVLAALAVVGVGIGLAFAPMTAAGLSAVPAANAGMASGGLLVTRMVGATFGVATTGTLFAYLEDRKLAGASADATPAAAAFSYALTGAMALTAAVAAVAGVLVFLLGRKPQPG